MFARREETISIINFVLLAYTDLFNKRAYDMVGTTKNPKELVVYSYDRDNKEMKQTYTYKHTSDIHAVIPSSFDDSKRGSLLLITKNQDGTFENNILFTESNTVLKLPNTTAAPLLLSKDLTLKPILLLQKKNGLITVEFDNQGKYTENPETSILEKGEKIHKDHTSTFVDLTGDHKADLALVTEKDKFKYLKVLKNTSNGFKKFFVMKLPEKTGPLIFNDLNKNGMNDLAFVSFEDGKYYLNVYFNTNSRTDPMAYKSSEKGLEFENLNAKIFSGASDFVIKQDLSHLSSGQVEFRLSCEVLGNVPSGIFDTDIDLDKNIEIFLIADKNKEGDIVFPLKFNPEKNEFDINKDMKTIMSEKNVISFSACDYKNEGRELWVVNKIDNNNPQVKIFPNILRPENMKISVTTVLDKTKTLYGCGIAGTSYLLSYDEGTNISIGNSLPPGPFLHLKNQTTTFGLGCRTFHINILRSTVPSYGDYKETYVVKYDIVQNFDLIVGIGKHGDYNIRAFIIADIYLVKIISVLITVIILNFIIVGILHFRHARKQREARTRDSMHPLFRSLG
ncbi:hypothetical protein NGRA_0665 [Nosema granulosis]|uniref:T-cell immunomodulatory protein n=1 Tax=Nosema granulosis TaxID=83296 RepID=A0A9P6L0B5_9MICR|nr:hypothetical protein NGRA_0665 [Nosema granulosis]